MDHTLKYIIREVTIKPKNGVAIKNNITGNWDVPFATLEVLKKNGFNTVEALISDVISKAKNNVTVYLKRSSGSSSEYRIAGNQKIKAVLKPLENTNVEVSQNVVPVPAVDSVGTTTFNKQPQKPAPIMNTNQQEQPTGLMGGLNMVAVENYSRAQQLGPTVQRLEKSELTNETLAAKVNRLELEAVHKEFQIKTLEKDLSDERAKPKKLISDEAAKIGFPIIEQIAGIFAAKSGAAALNGAAQQPQEQFSETKTALLGLIKDARFSDGLCQLLLDVNNKGVDNPEDFEKIKELAQTTQTT